MEKLRGIQIEGFKSIRNLDFELGDLTILIGANGSGKSNFIELFRMLGYLLSGQLQVFVQTKGGASSILHYGPPTLLKVHLEFADSQGISEYGLTMSHGSPDRLLFLDEYVNFHNIGQSKPFPYDLESGHTESRLLDLSRQGPSTHQKVANVFLNRLKEIEVYHFHDTSETSHMRLSQDLDRNRYLMSRGGNLAAFLYMLKLAYPRHFARIIETTRLAIPYLRGLILEPDRLNPKRIELRWEDRSGFELGIHQLSDGSLRVLALVTALLQPDEFLPGIVFIDEPELGLHPGAMSIVSQLIKTAAQKRQVVVATQSPRLLAEFSPEDVVVVERDEDDRGRGYSVFQRLSTESLGTWLDSYDLGSLFEMNITGGGPG